MPASRKKVIVRKFSQEWISGYLPPALFVEEGEVGILDLDGKVTPVPLSEVKWICFVREFASPDSDDQERLRMKAFLRRPRAQGLWLRARLRDSDSIEGLAQNDASLLDGDGFFLIPPDSRSNTQRIFIPRLAVKELEILGVIRSRTLRQASDEIQESLFRPPD